ncbi:hypothetical protein RhiirA4_455018 [Rhizophagus irregularis]|uniref:Uncharacterized protein n=1 Tax=Rhizophagus irregularis TaxID=588596 RepID=A0A2I1G497_9GLOM|nr:hypothetical protein RhiirA4_455018 [Rhizophagus irregularis]
MNKKQKINSPTSKNGKVLSPEPKDLVLGPGLQIFRSKFWTRSGSDPKKS